MKDNNVYIGNPKGYCHECGFPVDECNCEDDKNNIPGQYPGKEYQDLFDYLHNKHGLTLLQSELSDIVHMVHKHHPQPGAHWVIGQYERMYDQLQADPKRKIVCYVDYYWDRDKTKPALRDICTVRGETTEFTARGIGYGGAPAWFHESPKRDEFLLECERLKVQWLDESGNQVLPKEISEFIRDIAENWDCDTDSHTYNLRCRKCEAEKLLKTIKQPE